jgi:hypothetical protein
MAELTAEYDGTAGSLHKALVDLVSKGLIVLG